MKMMNTELEFVSFDAQDVIATSGGLTDYYGIIASNGAIDRSLFKDYTGWYLDKDYISIHEGLTKKFFAQIISTDGLTSGTEYVVTGAVRTGADIYFTYTKKSDVTLAPGAQNLYDSNAKPTMKNILDWLDTNQSLLQ